MMIDSIGRCVQIHNYTKIGVQNTNTLVLHKFSHFSRKRKTAVRKIFREKWRAKNLRKRVQNYPQIAQKVPSKAGLFSPKFKLPNWDVWILIYFRINLIFTCLINAVIDQLYCFPVKSTLECASIIFT